MMSRLYKRIISLIITVIMIIGLLPMSSFAEIESKNNAVGEVIQTSDVAIQNLKTEYLKNPIGIDVERPRFSWQMDSSKRDISQEYYQVKVYEGSYSGNIVWDSGKVASGKSVHIEYDGSNLEASKVYCWNVTVWDNHGGETISTEEACFETGLLSSGWSGAKWIKVATDEDNTAINKTEITKYTIEMDFAIKEGALGVSFAGSADHSKFYMWQINFQPANPKYAGQMRIRPHTWSPGGACLEEYDVTAYMKENGLQTLNLGQTYKLKIEVDGKIIKTYIDGDLVYTYTAKTNVGFGDVGFRESYENGVNDKAYVDNYVLKAEVDGEMINMLSENFDDAATCQFVGGFVDNGRIFVEGPGAEQRVWQKQTPVETNYQHYKLEMDLTLNIDNAGIIFSAKDLNNMYMWSLNTRDYSYPVIRGHKYVNGSPSTYNTRINEFTKADLISTEHHLTIEVTDNKIDTYIDGILVDTNIDTTNNLIDKYIGFRAHNDNNSSGVNETATYDNVVYTRYADKDDQTGQVVFYNDFENNKNLFDGGTIIDTDTSAKLKVNSKGGETKFLQSNATGSPRFAKKFDIDNNIKSARIYTSGLGVYDVFINGNRVGTKNADGTMVYDELKPGWTDYTETVYYSTYDVTDMLQTGTNAIGAIVTNGWWYGGISRGTYGNQALGFIAKLVVEYNDGSTKTIITDDSWSASIDGPVKSGDIYNGEKYYATLEDEKWATIDSNLSSWGKTAIHKGFEGKITAFVGPAVQVRPELERKPESITRYKGAIGASSDGSYLGVINVLEKFQQPNPIKVSKDETLVYDFGQNMVGWVKFTVKGKAGDTIKVNFGEMLNDTGERYIPGTTNKSRGNDGPKDSVYMENYRGSKSEIIYTLQGDENGETYNPTFSYFGFRYAQITTTGDVEVKSIVAEVVGSVTAEEGSSFETDNALVNQLYSNVQWGQRSNFISTPNDCPQRDERLGWTGDAQIFIRAASYNADVAGFFRKWMGDMRDGQLESGAYPDIAPNNHLVPEGNAAWTDAGIIVPWTVYLMYDDIGIIKENYDSMTKYINFVAAQKNATYNYIGILTGLRYGDWVQLDGKNIPEYVAVAYFAYISQLMSKMSYVLSQTEGDFYYQQAKHYDELYANIKTEFNQRFVNADGSLKSNYDLQTAYLLALKFDLFATAEHREVAIEHLVKMIADNGDRLNTGFVGTGVLNQTLSEIGAVDTAYNLLLQREYPSWLYSVDQGATTIWERWNSYRKDEGFLHDVSMNSFNHYAYGVVSEWMYRFVGGIEADESNPGFKHFILQPSPDMRSVEDLPAGQDNIRYANAKYASYYGIIDSRWDMGLDGRITYSAIVPANTSATLYLPLKENTDSILESGLPVSKSTGVTFVEIKDGKAIFELASGSYTFETKEQIKVSEPVVTATSTVDTVQLTWDYVDGESYKVLQKLDSQYIELDIAIVILEGKANAEIIGLESNKDYTFCVVANLGLDTANSNDITIRTKEQTGAPILVESVKINTDKLVMIENKTSMKIDATVYPENATDKKVTWKVSNKAILSIDENGVMTALKTGIVFVTATSGDKTYQVMVRVVS